MSLLVDMIRNGIEGNLNAKQVERLLVEIERLEKLSARLAAEKELLEAKVVELEAKIPPDNLIDVGRCFIKRLPDASIDDIPYCAVCRAPMNPGYPANSQGLQAAPNSYKCANEARCGFTLQGRDLASFWSSTRARVTGQKSPQPDWQTVSTDSQSKSNAEKETTK